MTVTRKFVFYVAAMCRRFGKPAAIAESRSKTDMLSILNVFILQTYIKTCYTQCFEHKERLEQSTALHLSPYGTRAAQQPYGNAKKTRPPWRVMEMQWTGLKNMSESTLATMSLVRPLSITMAADINLLRGPTTQ